MCYETESKQEGRESVRKYAAMTIVLIVMAIMLGGALYFGTLHTKAAKTENQNSGQVPTWYVFLEQRDMTCEDGHSFVTTTDLRLFFWNGMPVVVVYGNPRRCSRYEELRAAWNDKDRVQKQLAELEG